MIGVVPAKEGDERSASTKILRMELRLEQAFVIGGQIAPAAAVAAEEIPAEFVRIVLFRPTAQVFRQGFLVDGLIVTKNAVDLGRLPKTYFSTACCRQKPASSASPESSRNLARAQSFSAIFNQSWGYDDSCSPIQDFSPIDDLVNKLVTRGQAALNLQKR